MNKVKPISPNEITISGIPDIVIETVNALLKENFRHPGEPIIIRQCDIVSKLILARISKSEIFDKHYLDFEEIFRQAGWNVNYDKPARDEDYEPFFEFKKSARNGKPRK